MNTYMSYQHFLLFSQKGFKEFFTWHVHTSPDFSHRVFKEFKKIKTRPQEEQIDQGGVLEEK